ncbi:hypothetical protein [Saccharothrix violaceirubra]|uniref:Uncharacterized protein n=1 Tax=Saccharothrix violaceirubra TaxID=413306 RepID=A0A7W7SZ96_9PSEU|nr:hypothetical protein [Saccharothrix violaceirubra]MBB4963703.1 hypothetical protein [Saccharothrix violaceirubra]
MEAKGFRGARYIAVVLLVISVAALVLFGAVQAKPVQAVALGLIIALGSTITGALLGFVFGIPRRVQGESGTTGYAVNTNFEQISDWLTKIIIGLGLVELGSIVGHFGRLSTTLGAALGPGTATTVAAGATIVFFVPLGFLVGYLLTRTFLTDAFRSFDDLPANAVTDAVDRVGTLAQRRYRSIHADYENQSHLPADNRNRETVERAAEATSPVSDVVTLCGEIENLLAELLAPYPSQDLASDELVDLLAARGVVDAELADALKGLFEFARKVALGRPLAPVDAVAVRNQGTAVLAEVGRLRRIAGVAFEKHVVDTLLDAAGGRGWRVVTDALVSEVPRVHVDALVVNGAGSVMVEARSLRDPVAVADLQGWLDHVPEQPLVLVVPGDQRQRARVEGLGRRGDVRVVMWDLEPGALVPLVEELLGRRPG